MNHSQYIMLLVIKTEDIGKQHKEENQQKQQRRKEEEKESNNSNIQ